MDTNTIFPLGKTNPKEMIKLGINRIRQIINTVSTSSDNCIDLIQILYDFFQFRITINYFIQP